MLFDWERNDDVRSFLVLPQGRRSSRLRLLPGKPIKDNMSHHLITFLLSYSLLLVARARSREEGGKEHHILPEISKPPLRYN